MQDLKCSKFVKNCSFFQPIWLHNAPVSLKFGMEEHTTGSVLPPHPIGEGVWVREPYIF